MLDTQYVEDYLAEVRTKADELGLRDNLEAKLKYLAEYACNDEDPNATICVLGTDFAPLSFSFTMFRAVTPKDVLDEPREYWFNGGLIYYNSGETGAGAPQLSCRIGELNAGWSVNT